MTAERVQSVGGERLLPAPDPFARDYLLLALRLDQLIPGLVDSYFGPASLKAQVDTEQPRSAASLRANASAMLSRLPSEVADPDRRAWLHAQLVALEGQALILAGDPLAYADYVACCFDLMPERIPETVFETAADELDRLLPGPRGRETIPARIAAWDARFTLPGHRRAAAIDWLLALFRERTRVLFGLPDAEGVRVGFVTGQPWAAYNWYDGNCRSRVDLNTDLPIRVPDLLHLLAHEAYPGHHTEHSWKDRLLVEGLGRLEASAALINTPECLISEGLANLAERFVAPDDTLVELLMELYERAGLDVAAEPAAARDAAERQLRIRRALVSVRAVPGNAAFLLHADGLPRAEVLAYLEQYLLTTTDRAEKRLSFIEHPLWKAYVFVYFEGERLLRRWLEVVPSDEQADRFRRLLQEPITPGAIVAELDKAGVELDRW